MEEKYKIINDRLNEYCKRIDDTIYMEDLHLFFYLTINTVTTIYENDIAYQSSIEKYASIYSFYQKRNIYLSSTQSLDIVRNFIKNKIPVFLDNFDEYIKNGVLDFIDSDTTTENDYSYSGISDDNKREIHAIINHNYEDLETIIHEFIHQLNLEESPVSKTTRLLLTEGISIYFEMLLFKYLEEKGYNIEEISKIKKMRINDCARISDEILTELTLIDSYMKFGSINENTWKDRKELCDFGWSNKEGFEFEIRNLLGDKKEYKFKYINNIGYIVGTLIAFYAINQPNDEMTNKFIKLNELVNTENFYECLKYIGIDFSKDEDIDKLFITFKDEILKINEIYENNHILKKQ
ncbi:MAG: hypothetical protein E7160_00215 [Firmicutes bacterium]|nr:hypothetical protein [Bacillota bacterium]